LVPSLQCQSVLAGKLQQECHAFFIDIKQTLCCSPYAGTSAQSHWFSWAGARWQLSCSFHPAEDRLGLSLRFQPKGNESCNAYVSLHVLDRRHQGSAAADASRYMPLHSFSRAAAELGVPGFLHLSGLCADQSPYLLNDSIMIAAQISSEPLVVEELLPQHGELMPSPFTHIFGGNLTRFMNGSAFAEVRLAVFGADPQTAFASSPLAHISRLGRISGLLRQQLGVQLKALKVRPQGFGVWQPLVSLDTSQHVLQAFHKLLYEPEVRIPQQLLGGLLDLAAKYDMPELELWALQQAQKAGRVLQKPTGELMGLTARLNKLLQLRCRACGVCWSPAGPQCGKHNWCSGSLHGMSAVVLAFLHCVHNTAPS
jgi:hypothetical protein